MSPSELLKLCFLKTLGEMREGTWGSKVLTSSFTLSSSTLNNPRKHKWHQTMFEDYRWEIYLPVIENIKTTPTQCQHGSPRTPSNAASTSSMV